MTAQLATQLLPLVIQVLVVLVLPMLAAYATKLLSTATEHIKDQRARLFVRDLVAEAEALIPATKEGKQLRYHAVADDLHAKMPWLPEDEIQTLIESAVADLHLAMGTFTAPVADVPAPAPTAPTGVTFTTSTPVINGGNGAPVVGGEVVPLTAISNEPVAPLAPAAVTPAQVTEPTPIK